MQYEQQGFRLCCMSVFYLFHVSWPGKNVIRTSRHFSSWSCAWTTNKKTIYFWMLLLLCSKHIVTENVVFVPERLSGPGSFDAFDLHDCGWIWALWGSVCVNLLHLWGRLIIRKFTWRGFDSNLRKKMKPSVHSLDFSCTAIKIMLKFLDLRVDYCRTSHWLSIS